MSKAAVLDMRAVEHVDASAHTLSSIVTLLGRACFSAIFLDAVPHHFRAQTIAYAAGHGVPMASVLVPASGVMVGLGAASVLFGFRARLGAWLLVAFLVPVTLVMHAFWAEGDPVQAALQQGMFLKNLSVLGGALLITRFGSGPMSLDRH